MAQKIAFRASTSEVAQAAYRTLVARHGTVPEDKADVIVALGGDGFMLETLNATIHLDTPVYGMNCGTIGFLMNEYAEDRLPERVAAAEEERSVVARYRGPLLEVRAVGGGGGRWGCGRSREGFWPQLATLAASGPATWRAQGGQWGAGGRVG